jgi:hypothetical protein
MIAPFIEEDFNDIKTFVVTMRLVDRFTKNTVPGAVMHVESIVDGVTVNGNDTGELTIIGKQSGVNIALSSLEVNPRPDWSYDLVIEYHHDNDSDIYVVDKVIDVDINNVQLNFLVENASLTYDQDKLMDYPGFGFINDIRVGRTYRLQFLFRNSSFSNISSQVTMPGTFLDTLSSGGPFLTFIGNKEQCNLFLDTVQIQMPFEYTSPASISVRLRDNNDNSLIGPIYNVNLTVDNIIPRFIVVDDYTYGEDTTTTLELGMISDISYDDSVEYTITLTTNIPDVIHEIQGFTKVDPNTFTRTATRSQFNVDLLNFTLWHPVGSSQNYTLTYTQTRLIDNVAQGSKLITVSGFGGAPFLIRGISLVEGQYTTVENMVFVSDGLPSTVFNVKLISEVFFDITGMTYDGSDNSWNISGTQAFLNTFFNSISIMSFAPADSSSFYQYKHTRIFDNKVVSAGAPVSVSSGSDFLFTEQSSFKQYQEYLLTDFLEIIDSDPRPNIEYTIDVVVGVPTTTLICDIDGSPNISNNTSSQLFRLVGTKSVLNSRLSNTTLVFTDLPSFGNNFITVSGTKTIDNSSPSILTGETAQFNVTPLGLIAPLPENNPTFVVTNFFDFNLIAPVIEVVPNTRDVLISINMIPGWNYRSVNNFQIVASRFECVCKIDQVNEYLSSVILTPMYSIGDQLPFGTVSLLDLRVYDYVSGNTILTSGQRNIKVFYERSLISFGVDNTRVVALLGRFVRNIFFRKDPFYIHKSSTLPSGTLPDSVPPTGNSRLLQLFLDGNLMTEGSYSDIVNFLTNYVVVTNLPQTTSNLPTLPLFFELVDKDTGVQVARHTYRPQVKSPFTFGYDANSNLEMASGGFAYLDSSFDRISNFPLKIYKAVIPNLEEPTNYDPNEEYRFNLGISQAALVPYSVWQPPTLQNCVVATKASEVIPSMLAETWCSPFFNVNIPNEIVGTLSTINQTLSSATITMNYYMLANYNSRYDYSSQFQLGAALTGSNLVIDQNNTVSFSRVYGYLRPYRAFIPNRILNNRLPAKSLGNDFSFKVFDNFQSQAFSSTTFKIRLKLFMVDGPEYITFTEAFPGSVVSDGGKTIEFTGTTSQLSNFVQNVGFSWIGPSTTGNLIGIRYYLEDSTGHEFMVGSRIINQATADS